MNLTHLILVDLSDLNSSITMSSNRITTLLWLELTQLPNLSGSFPLEIFEENTFLEWVIIEETALSGNFSLDGLCRKHDLIWLGIGYNNFNPWTIPECLSTSEFLSVLRLSGHNVHGTIPPEMCSIRMQALILQNTSLSGTIPSNLGDAMGLTTMHSLLMFRHSISARSITLNVGDYSVCRCCVCCL